MGSHIHRLLVAVVMMMSACFAFAQSQEEITVSAAEVAKPLAPAERYRFSLLTCGPGEETYSLYGHTALRLQDMEKGSDWTFNYGVFNFKQKFFALRFALGLTDYELGAVPMKWFLTEYRRTGRYVTEQRLNLTDTETLRLLALLSENMMEENVVYRYNFFYDNCTTRARDIIESALEGRLEYAEKSKIEAKDAPTWRELTHHYTADHAWDAFGNDLCLGFKADLATTWRERQFLPLQLMADFDGATVLEADGSSRKIVAEKVTLLKAEPAKATTDSPLASRLTPTLCASLLFLLTFAVMIWERQTRRTAWIFDVGLMAVQGIVGIAATLLLVSQHPTTSTNLQVLLLNPLPLLFVYKVARRRATRYWLLMAVLGALMFVGSFVQDYAEGMRIVALCLLLRCSVHIGQGHAKPLIRLKRQ